MENNELYHWGIPGMKWGIRRFQNEDGSLTEEGRTRYGVKARRSTSLISALKKRKQEKEAAKKKEKARKEREAKRNYKKNREQAIKTGSAEEALKYKNDLSIEEKKAIYNRLLADNDLIRLANTERENRIATAKEKSLGTKLGKVADSLGKASTAIENVAKFYNSGAKVYNAFSDKPLPIIGDKKENDYYAYSKKLATNLLKKSPNLSVREMQEELNRISTIENVEKYRAGSGRWTYRDFSTIDRAKAAQQAAAQKKPEPKNEPTKKQLPATVNSGTHGVKGMQWDTRSKTNWIDADRDYTEDPFTKRKKKK